MLVTETEVLELYVNSSNVFGCLFWCGFEV